MSVEEVEEVAVILEVGEESIDVSLNESMENVVEHSVVVASSSTPSTPSSKPRLNEWERKQICIFKRDNPKVPQKKIAEHFTAEFGRFIGIKAVYYTLQEFDKWISLDHPSSRVKVSRQIKCPELEQQLFMWIKAYVSEKSFDTLTNAMIKKQAMLIATELGVVNQFGFSQSWLNRIKNRFTYWLHRETGVSINEGEKKFTPEAVRRSEDEIQDYNVEDVFMMGDVELLYGLTPSYSGPSSMKSAVGVCEKISVVLCTNATGSEKPQAIVVGARHLPPSFGSDFDSSQYVEYFSNVNSRLNVHIYRKWLKSFDKRMSESGRKVVLLVGNAPWYTTGGVTFQNVRVHIKPANSPLNGLMQAFKINYRKLQIKSFIQDIEEGKTSTTVNMRLAVMLVKEAWDDIKDTTIVAHWKSAGLLPTVPQEVPPKDIINEEKNKALLELSNLLQFYDSRLRALKFLSAELDIQENEKMKADRGDCSATPSSSTGDVSLTVRGEMKEIVSLREARAGLHTLITFMEKTESVGEEEFATLQALANKLMTAKNE